MEKTIAVTRICVKHSGLRQLAATAKTAGSVDGVDSSVDGVDSSVDGVDSSVDSVDSSSGDSLGSSGGSVGSSVDSVGSSSDGGDHNSDGGNGGKQAAMTTVCFGPLKMSENLVIPLICTIAIYLHLHESKINTGVQLVAL